MKNHPRFIALAVTALLALLPASCSGETPDIQAELGQEVSLAIGQQMTVTGADLGIRFVDVTEDSRCPRDVTCVWQGRATCALQITAGGVVQDMNVAEPGRHTGPSSVTFGNYRIYYQLMPYPTSTTKIAKADYHLQLRCTAAGAPLETAADFTGFITDIQPATEPDPVGRVSVESHADKIVTKYVVSVNKNTFIFRQNAESISPGNFAALENRQWVKLWFSGPVLESFPMQATASQILILE